MKTIISILLLIVSSQLLSQFNIDWETDIGGADNEDIYKIFPTSDGHSLLIGISPSVEFNSNSDSNGGNLGYVAKLTENGSMKWEEGYGIVISALFNAIEVSDGYILIGYKTTDELNGDIDLWLLKLDFDGKIIWELLHGTPGGDYGIDMTKTNDGGYVVVGSTESASTLVMKFSDKDELEWEKSYENVFEYGTKILQDANGGYLICGVDYSSGFPDRSYLLYKLDAGGEIEWKKIFDCGSSENLFPTLNILPNNEYLIGGSCGGDAKIFKVDADGNLIWQRYIGGLGDELLLDIEITAGGNVLGSGFTTSDSLGLESGFANLLLFELDTDGAISKQDIYGDGLFNEGAALTKVDDNYFLSGITNEQESVIKLSPKPLSTYLPDPTSALRLFPNPSRNKINIEVNQENIGSSYTIYSSSGQAVSEGMLNNIISNISIQDLAKGIYKFKLNQDNNLIVTFSKY